MTAIKPIDNRNVHSVASERYPLNKTCAHPECKEPAFDPHHAFPRSLIGGDSWFVQIDLADGEYVVIPHVTGLCRAHHDELEQGHGGRKSDWLRYDVEGDGLWTWWYRNDGKDGVGQAVWAELGPLNPQPGSVEGRPKRARYKGEKRRKRRVISIRVPNDEQEDGAGLLDEKFAALRELLGQDENYPPYYVVSAAVDYTLLNADATDFEEAS